MVEIVKNLIYGWKDEQNSCYWNCFKKLIQLKPSFSTIVLPNILCYVCFSAYSFSCCRVNKVGPVSRRPQSETHLLRPAHKLQWRHILSLQPLPNFSKTKLNKDSLYEAGGLCLVLLLRCPDDRSSGLPSRPWWRSLVPRGTLAPGLRQTD